MAGKFLIKSRHGTVYYFRRRVPDAVQHIIGRRVIVQSLATSDRRVAVVRGRLLATQTDSIFHQIAMTKKTNDGSQFDLTVSVDIFGFGKFEATGTPEEQEAIDASVSNFVKVANEHRLASSAVQIPNIGTTAKPKHTFDAALVEYLRDAQISPQTKATYRSKLNHAKAFFGEDSDIVTLDQPALVRYCAHVKKSIANITTQGLYISTVASFLNWHRVSQLGLSGVTTQTLIPRKETPDSDDRDAFTLEQLRLVFENAAQYLRKDPSKFWVSIAPALLV